METKLEILARLIDMPADHVRESAAQMRTERKREQLMEKLRIIRSGNTAITKDGEIVDRTERPDALPYQTLHSSTNVTVQPPATSQRGSMSCENKKGCHPTKTR